MKKSKKIKIIIASTIFVLLLLFFFGVTPETIYYNMNPDMVNVKKDGWKKVISFVTPYPVKKHRYTVEIYGRPIKKENSGEFVIVRKKILPFGLVSIAPKLVSSRLWREDSCVCESLGGRVLPVTWFWFQIGDMTGEQKWWFSQPMPSIRVSFAKACGKTFYEKQEISYMYFDNFSILDRLKMGEFEINFMFIIKSSSFKPEIKINQDLEKIFPKPFKEEK